MNTTSPPSTKVLRAATVPGSANATLRPNFFLSALTAAVAAANPLSASFLFDLHKAAFASDNFTFARASLAVLRAALSFPAALTAAVAAV